jgi:hypothetical protein
VRLDGAVDARRAVIARLDAGRPDPDQIVARTRRILDAIR